MRAIVTFTLITTLAVLLPIGTVMAISVEPVSYEQTLANAEMIMVGTITDVQTRWSGYDESMIATDYTIRLDHIAHDPQALFGNKSQGETIVLSFAGGTIGDKWVAVPGIPSYELGEQAVFFIDGDWIKGISPLVGATAGDYRVSDEGLVTDGTGRLVDRTFFSGGVDKGNGFSIEEFVAEIKRALPFAEADKSLEITNEVEISEDIAHLVFSGDQIPKSVPILSDDYSVSYEVDKTDSDPRTPEAAPEPMNEVILEAGPEDFDELVVIPQDKYAFLWGPPDRTSNFNIPPIYYSGAEWGQNFEYCLSDWNMYADLFRKFTTSDNQFGHQGRNDFAFTDWTTFQAVYGFSLPSSVLGIAVMFNSLGNNINTGEKIYESDIILNVDKSWTLTWSVGYANCSIWYFRSTVIHEAGHCFGREHQFTADPAATYHSVMNYPPCGALDTEFWLPLVDDPQSIRAAYPSNINAINDLGVELYRTAGGGGSSGIPVVWSTFNSSVVAGNNFSMNNFIIENLGTTTMTPAIGWYLTPSQQSYTGSYYVGATTHSALGPFSYWNTSRTLTCPVSVPPGNYYIAAAIQSDDHDWNRSCWTNTTITVTCPQVATPTGLTGTAGCGYIDLSWNAATNATSYRVYRDGALLTTVGGTSYRDNSPGASQRCYRVAGQNDCDLSSQSSQVCRTALSVPASVTGLSCTAGCGYIDVSWNQASGATAYRLYRDGALLTTIAGTSYRDNSPGASERCYSVRASNACGLAPATQTSCCTALTTPPALTGLTCSPGCGVINLDWSPSAGATSYRVYRDGSFYTSVQGSGYQDTNPGTGQRCYHVTAVNTCGESGDSPRACCTALQPPPPLTALNCEPRCGAIALSWSASAGATSYRIFRDGTPYSSTSGTSWTDTSPTTGEHCYTVTAENACGPSAHSPEACCTALFIPAPPNSLTCSPGCGYIQLTWPASAGATQYRVYRDGAILVAVGGTAYQDNSPGAAERCYVVTAVNTCGESDKSPEACCTAGAGPAQVLGLQATTTVCDTIKLRWSAVAGATGYRIYRNGAGHASIPPATTFDDYIGFDACYEYEVTALNDCAEGPPSDPVSGCSECAATTYNISGYMVYYDMVKHIPDVTVDLSGNAVATTFSDGSGWYGFGPLPTGNYQVTPSRPDDDGGVSIGDVVKIRRHLAFIELLDSPYKLLAADVNCGGTVSVSDIIKIRRYLAQLEGLPCGNWVFIDSSFAITNANWFAAPQMITGGLTYDWTDSSFVGVRYGDVNNTWSPGPAPPVVARTVQPGHAAGGAVVVVRDVLDAKAGDLVKVAINAGSAGKLAGLELHLDYSFTELSLIDVSSSSLKNFTANTRGEEIHLVWEDINDPVQASDETSLFTLTFRVAEGLNVPAEIGIRGEIVDESGDPYFADWQAGTIVVASPSPDGSDAGMMPESFYLSANYPNPFNPETHIDFGLPQASHVSLCIYNVMGQRVACLIDQAFGSGNHQVTWDGRDETGVLVGSGVYFYRLEAGSFTQTRKMTLMK
ncbi:MAG: T9SS type A sorting domain-containing protein [candidate division Zixibacteria bacterium]|nr:T9SS type A sorting domain-containing protein [candidate division Zixibacteria bacterium]MDH3936780.1 T9SS type A sorting domain-containing protein [candidate division Zixibacteria bacterium]MDH4032427.1 T9SS type A sorting domain-containing protein [candidate division Zixibacteria bacterium]